MPNPYEPYFDQMKLIDEIEKRPCLWNEDHEHYANKTETTKHWQEISTLFGIKKQILRLKWKNLKRNFRREIQRRNLKNLEEYNGQWRYFHRIRFIYTPHKFDEYENKESNAIISNKNEESIAKQDETSHAANNCQRLPDKEVDEISSRKRIIALKDDENKPLYIKRKKIDKTEDFDVMFLRSLTPYMKQLDPVRKLIVRNNLQQLLLDEITLQKDSK